MKKILMLIIMSFGCGVEPKYVRVPAEDPPPAQPQPLAQPHTPTYTLEEKRDIPTPTANDWSFMYI